MRKMKQLITVLMVILVIKFKSCNGNKKEVCRHSHGKIFCQEKDLKEIPSNILGPGITTLLLYDNQIESTKQLDVHLSMFGNLQVLDMHNNRLNRVPQAPKSIKKLDLDSNKISRIAKDLNNMRELKVLSLRSNNLNEASFDLNTFSENNQMEELNLDYNELKLLPKNLPLNLKFYR